MEISDESGDRLRAVFDLCDTKNRNFISVQHFTELAKEHFGAGDGSGLEVGLQVRFFITIYEHKDKVRRLIKKERLRSNITTVTVSESQCHCQ